MADKLVKRLLAAAAFQSRGDSDAAATAFMEVATSDELPQVIRSFLQREQATRVRANASTPSWPFRSVAATKPTRQVAETCSDDEESMMDDDDVTAGLEEDFVDMGLTDAMDDAVLELSAAEDDDSSDEDDDSEKEEASPVQSTKAFARTLRNLHALAAAKKKKSKKKAVKKN